MTRFPRTLHEAFNDADRAQWLYHVTPYQRSGSRILSVALAVFIGAAITITLIYGG